ncbi:MAG: hypothetical protein OXT67_05505 [Zetaproteobacteria bacterium]|nr:hypothetical protein [Zetaproteobacteria bacterium]
MNFKQTLFTGMFSAMVLSCGEDTPSKMNVDQNPESTHQNVVQNLTNFGELMLEEGTYQVYAVRDDAEDWNQVSFIVHNTDTDIQLKAESTQIFVTMTCCGSQADLGQVQTEVLSAQTVKVGAVDFKGKRGNWSVKIQVEDQTQQMEFALKYRNRAA